MNRPLVVKIAGLGQELKALYMILYGARDFS